MRIGEVSRLLGLSAATLRYYERQGLALPPARWRGKRWYGAAEIARLRLLKTARAAGLGIAELRSLAAGKGDRGTLLRRQLAKTEAEVSALNRRMALLRTALECGCSEIGNCRLA